jgi:hypothetical protein
LGFKKEKIIKMEKQTAVEWLYEAIDNELRITVSGLAKVGL